MELAYPAVVLNGQLTGALGRQWAVRVPTLVFTVGVPLSAAVGIGMWVRTPSEYATTVSEAVSGAWFLDAVLGGLFLAAFLMSWFTPRLSGWLFAGVATCAARWWSPRRRHVSLGRWGLKVHDFPFDRVVDPRDLDDVSAELTELLPDDVEVNELLARAKLAAEDDPRASRPTWWPRVLPSAGLLVGLLTFACWVLPAYVG